MKIFVLLRRQIYLYNLMFEFLTRDHEDSISDYGDNDNDRTIKSQTTERDTAEFEVFLLRRVSKLGVVPKLPKLDRTMD